MLHFSKVGVVLGKLAAGGSCGKDYGKSVFVRLVLCDGVCSGACTEISSDRTTTGWEATGKGRTRSEGAKSGSGGRVYITDRRKSKHTELSSFSALWMVCFCARQGFMYSCRTTVLGTDVGSHPCGSMCLMYLKFMAMYRVCEPSWITEYM